jgi:hypothetical protein
MPVPVPPPPPVPVPPPTRVRGVAGGVATGVAVDDRDLIGGERAYWARIPSKTLLRATEGAPWPGAWGDGDQT